MNRIRKKLHQLEALEGPGTAGEDPRQQNPHGEGEESDDAASAP